MTIPPFSSRRMRTISKAIQVVSRSGDWVVESFADATAPDVQGASIPARWMVRCDGRRMARPCWAIPVVAATRRMTPAGRCNRRGRDAPGCCRNCIASTLWANPARQCRTSRNQFTPVRDLAPRWSVFGSTVAVLISLEQEGGSWTRARAAVGDKGGACLRRVGSICGAWTRRQHRLASLHSVRAGYGPLESLPSPYDADMS